MTRGDLLAILAILALLAAIAADVLALHARRYAARALLTAHTHRRRTDPPPTPRNLAVDRRLDDRGPPPGQPERRRHRDPDNSRARRRDVDEPQWHTVDQPLSEADAAAERARYVRQPRGIVDVNLPEPPTVPGLEAPPGPLGDRRGPDEPPPTTELEPPTRDMRAVRPQSPGSPSPDSTQSPS